MKIIKYIIVFSILIALQNAYSKDLNQNITNERLNSLQQLHKNEGYCDLNKIDLEKLKQFIDANKDETVVFFKIDAEYELVLRRHNKRLEPDGIIRIKSPVKDKNITEEAYAAKVVEYITGKWIKEHPDKPYYFHPHCKPQKQKDGTWWCETGPAVISGHGLKIVLNADFSLIELSEIFNAE